MNRIPKHIAIIMDGNGRWAEEHDLTRSEGHRVGAEAIEKIVSACKRRKVKYLTLYAFSSENWMRPDDEIVSLMGLLRHFLAAKRDEMKKEGIRFMTIGDIPKLPVDVQDEIARTIRETKNCADMVLAIALSYGSRQEILRAVNRLIAKKKGAALREPQGAATVEEFEGELYTAGIPDPDLLIRTSGEYRISNFLLWQAAYTELYFTETLWPDFNEQELDRAIESYASRQRRFGMTGEQVEGKT